MWPQDGCLILKNTGGQPWTTGEHFLSVSVFNVEKTFLRRPSVDFSLVLSVDCTIFHATGTREAGRKVNIWFCSFVCFLASVVERGL